MKKRWVIEVENVDLRVDSDAFNLELSRKTAEEKFLWVNMLVRFGMVKVVSVRAKEGNEGTI